MRSTCRWRTRRAGLSASLYRGARAAAESGGFRTYVLGDRITRASCFVCRTTDEAVQLAAVPRCARRGDAPLARGARGGRGSLRHAKLREVETHVVGPMCHVLWAIHDRRRLRAEHDDPQRLRTEHGLRDGARAGEAASARSSRRTWAATRSRRTATSSAAGTARPSSSRPR